MQINLLKALVGEIAGEPSIPIVDILFNKKDINEFLISKKMNMTINQVRNILYRLSALGLVGHIRKKDKRKGWYIYFWTLNTEKCLVLLAQDLKNKLEQLNHLLDIRQTKRFYVCKPCQIEVSEETALEHDFMCEECAEVYALSKNEAKIRELKGKITRKQKELEVIQTEVKVIREKSAKKRSKKDAKEKAIKDLEKSNARKARAAEKKKEQKKLEKKSAKNPKKKTKKLATKKLKTKKPSKSKSKKKKR